MLETSYDMKSGLKSMKLNKVVIRKKYLLTAEI
jgi:hypothetical protein